MNEIEDNADNLEMVVEPIDEVQKFEQIIIEIMKIIMVYKGDLIKTNRANNSALSLAYEIKDELYYKLLIQHCDTQNFISSKVGRTLLTKMVKNKRNKFLKITFQACRIKVEEEEFLFNLARAALKENSKDAYEIILNHCNNRNMILSNGETFLTDLINIEDDDGIIEEVIRSGYFDLNVVNAKEESALMLACSKLKQNVVKSLLQCGSDVKYKNFAAVQATCLAKAGNVSQETVAIADEIVNMLCNMEATKNNEIKLTHAVEEIDLVRTVTNTDQKVLQLMKLLLVNKGDLIMENSEKENFLSLSYNYNNKSFFHAILKSSKKTLRVFSNEGSVTFIKTLIDKKDWVNLSMILDKIVIDKISNNNLLDVALMVLEKDEFRTYQILMNNCFDFNSKLTNGETFLTSLFKHNIEENLIKEVIQSEKFQIDLPNEKNETPLMLACSQLMPNLVEIMLKQGCDVSHAGYSAVVLAVKSAINSEVSQENQIKILSLLCGHGEMKPLQTKMINNICVINPQSVNSLKGKAVAEKYIIFECDGKQCWALLKWKGIINNGRICLGCDIKIKSNFGTNGTFVNQSIFKCDDGCGVLIPVDKIENCCVTEGHKKLSINNNRIDEKTICCIKPTKESKLNNRIQINERIRKINGKETGIFKWVGLINKEEIIGLDSKSIDKEGTDGTFCEVKLFNCNDKCGALFEPTCFECDLKRIADIGVSIIDPFNVISIENGMKIKRKMYLNRKIGKQIIHIEWRGNINGELCVGCELANMSEYGTDGTFNGQKLFKCGDRKGILIPVDELFEGCESDNHKEFVKFDGIYNRLFGDIKSINPEYICCVEWLRNINEWPELKIDSRIKYKNQDIYGTCEWIGLVNGKEAVGVEMDNECKGTNGRFSSFDLFNCMDGRGVLFTADDIEHIYFHYERKEIPKEDRIFPEIDINSAVKYYFKLNNNVKELFGTVKWTGVDANRKYFYGLELNDRIPNGTDGEFNGQQLFQCRLGHGILAPINHITRNSTFIEEEMSLDEIPSSKDSEKIYLSALAKLVPGQNKGIQGNANSCYFDSSIFALFSTSDVLDFMISPILNELDKNDITKEFRKIISWKIIYPLREFGFVTFHKTNEMRNVIKKYGPKFEEMVTQESDMENVSKFLAKLCPDEQLLSMISFDHCKNNSMFLQLFLILDRKLEFMTSEEMLKLSMVQNNIMFDELPSCLIMQAPRDAKGNNCYKYVLPKDIIEISDICSNYLKKCSKCSKEARFLCKKCMDKNKPEISNCYMCDIHKCHHGDVIKISRSTTKSKSKVFMELKAIICIEKCHFVAYVKQAEMIKKTKSTVKENQWYLFDSMSTQSTGNKYAIPKVTFSEEVSHFLNMSQDQMKMEIRAYDSIYSIKRIVLDSYIFVYHNPAKTCY